MATSAGPGRRRRGPNDPNRRDDIARAARSVVEERGPSGLTHRRVAERAGVPLGSTTYHFATLTDLLGAALSEIVTDHARHVETWAVGLTHDTWRERVANLLLEQSEPGAARQRLLVEFEIYNLAARSPALRASSRDWDAVLRQTLQRELGDVAGRTVFCVYNGLALASLSSADALDRGQILAVLGCVDTGSTQPFDDLDSQSSTMGS